VARISVVPTLTPVTAPVARLTVATAALGDTQTTARPGNVWLSVPRTVTAGRTVCPTINVNSAGRIAIDRAGGGAGVGGALAVGAGAGGATGADTGGAESAGACCGVTVAGAGGGATAVASESAERTGAFAGVVGVETTLSAGAGLAAGTAGRLKTTNQSTAADATTTRPARSPRRLT
jgi:hypothetical protein